MKTIQVSEDDSGPVSKEVNQLDGIPDRRFQRRDRLGGLASRETSGKQGQDHRRRRAVVQRNAISQRGCLPTSAPNPMTSVRCPPFD